MANVAYASDSFGAYMANQPTTAMRAPLSRPRPPPISNSRPAETMIFGAVSSAPHSPS
jgi:hypothetical protein